MPTVYSCQYRTVDDGECFKVVHKIRVKDSHSLAIRHMLGNKKTVPKSAHG